MAFVNQASVRQFASNVRQVEQCSQHELHVVHVPRNKLYFGSRKLDLDVLVLTRHNKLVRISPRDDGIKIELV